MRVLFLLTTLAGVAGAASVEGTAALDDGEPPTAAIVVRARCAGEVVAETEADGRGRFRLRWEGGASDCRIEASHPGYRAAALAVEQLPQAAAIPSLALHREGEWQGETVSATFLTAPEPARRAYEKGVRSLRAGNYPAAEAAFAAAVEASPEYAAAWFERARLRLAADDAEGARELLVRATRADPWFVPPYQPLLLLELQAGRLETVVELATRLLRLNPHLAEVRFRRALAAFELGDTEQARADVAALEGETFPGLEPLRTRLAREAGR